jgi:outer membrane receptor for ferrienterochelin and colicins
MCTPSKQEVRHDRPRATRGPRSLPVLCLLLACPSVCPADRRDIASLSIECLLSVTVKTASLHRQKPAEAPASVTVITREDIWKYGYRTLSDALQYVRGFYDTYDRTYHLPGVRGLSVAGDYGSRILVMIDGHRLMSSTDGSNPFGEDLPIDLSLVKQIEIVRGPTSALYGSSGVMATINVISLSPREAAPLEVNSRVGSSGTKELQASAALRAGPDSGTLVSSTVLNNGGEQNVYVPEFDNPQNNFGRAVRSDGERGYRYFMKALWKGWSLMAAGASRRKVQPLSWATVFNDAGNRVQDTRSFVDASYMKEWTHGTLAWRTFYDSVAYHGVYHYNRESRIVEDREDNTSDWVGSDAHLRIPATPIGALTLGIETRSEIRTRQTAYIAQPSYRPLLKIDSPDRSFAFLIQDELPLFSRWSLDLGLRLDTSRYRSDAVTPRVALIYQNPDRWSWKLMYGRAFRNPTAYEMFYADGATSIANPHAQAEAANVYEASAERRLSKSLSAVLSGYRYELRNMLVAQFDAAGYQQYRNLGCASANGVELELNGVTRTGIEAHASIAVQRTTDRSGSPHSNSPGQIGKLWMSAPLLSGRLSLSGGLQFLGSRNTNNRRRLPALLLPEIVVSSAGLASHFSFQFGIRNLFNHHWSAPVALDPRVDAIRQPGRTFVLALVART